MRGRPIVAFLGALVVILSCTRAASTPSTTPPSPQTTTASAPAGRRQPPSRDSAAKLRAGTVWINAYRVLGPYAPFGGFGNSGLGRENGADAINEYTEVKSVWVELTGATRDPFKLG